MYSFFFGRKFFLNGFGNIYEDFKNCSIRFQLELGDTQSSTCSSPVKGGLCLGFQSLNKCISSKDQSTVSLCFISWLIWDASDEVNTAFLLFDLNQWYKEQMPSVPRWSHCSNYLIRNSVGELLFDIKIDQKSLVQFIGLQRLEQHFCPTALSFDLQGLTQNGILKFHNKSMQRHFLDQIADSQHLALLRPDHFCEQIFTLGLTPLFSDYPSLNSSLQLDDQREFLLSVALEQRLVGWLCQAATKLANNAFSSSGLTIYNILNWAFHRAIVLKNSLYQYCVSLFDYSETRLDDNTLTMLLAGINQMRNLCSLYRYVSNKLIQFVADGEQLLEEQRSLEHLVTYFEVVLWMTNVGLLPECQPRSGILFNLVSAPYLIDDLQEYYSNKREQLQLASKKTFVEKDCLLFIDNMINNQTGGELIRQQWQEDGGTGLYPPPSLQSVLRIYLLDGLDVTFKHSFVTYTLLDIAMTVDEHNKIVKLLLKFPQIFNLSQSIIKIVQAFWHLDHDDYETALESILDPSVLVEDLQPWHHSAMMRSLLTQNQPGLALLYLQIRKPPIQEEKDLLTVVSLLISKNMLDDAFKFRDQHKGTADESALLTHIFNECNKNELLHTLLYRRLSTPEEKAFFKYLQGNRSPKYDDLQIFYYLLRSRFLEAFDSYSVSKRKQPSAQGLIGQRDASTTDNVVKMFKNLLPDVNRNLVATVRKERTNLWKEIPRPTPFSVFVYNPKDQVHYKSSIIFAALSKAKQTFNDAADKTGLETELTPFLRTPRMFIGKPVQSTPVLKCRVVEQKIPREEYGPSPPKKFRLSPRAPMATPIKKKTDISNSVQSNFHTPIVKRKRKSLETTNTPAILPQSILKTRTFLEDSVMNDDSSTNPLLKLDCENSITKARFALTPRKAIGTPLKSHVKFDDLRYSTNSEASKGKILSSREDASTSLRGIVTTSVETNDFSCPNLALEVQENVVAGKCSTPLVKSNTLTRTDQDVRGQLPEATVSIVGKAQIPIEENDLSTNRFSYQSPKARRSYKRSFGENVVPVRTSPRLAKKLAAQEASTTSPSKTVGSAKLKPRRSLTRSVLEHNAFSKLNADESRFKEPSRSNETVEFSFSSVSCESIKLDNTISLSSLSFDAVSNNASTSFASKTTEVRSMEVSRASVQSSRTGELMGLNNSRKYDFMNDEVFADEEIEPNKAQLQEDEKQTGPITIDEELSNSTAADSVDDISTQEQSNHSKDSQESALNVYEDLSSGSEDMRLVLEGIKDKSSANEQIDPPSTSKRNTEHEIHAVSGDTAATLDYGPVLSAYDDCQEPSHQQSFVNQSNIIEILSSSEDELNDGQMLQTDEETSFRLHISRPSNRLPVVANEFEKCETTFGETNSQSRNDLENNEETHHSDKYEHGSICIESSREDDECPEESAVVELHAHPEEQHVSIADHTFDESNKELTPSSTAEVTSDKEITEVLEKGDESTDDENSVYGSPKSLHTSGFGMSELDLEKPDDTTTASNKHCISIQCTLAAKDLEAIYSEEAPKINDTEECKELSVHQRAISVQCTLHEKDATIEQSVQVKESSPEMLKLTTVKKTYKKSQASMDTTSKLAAHETHDSLSLPVEAQDSISEPQHSTGMQGILPDDNPIEDVESDEEIIKNDVTTAEMVLRTVRKSYRGPKSLLDATPKLAVDLTTRTYSKKTKANLFDDSNTKESNDDLASITVDRDIIVTDEKPDNSQENPDIEETDNKTLVDVEREGIIAKAVDTSPTETFEATTNLSTLTKKTYSKNADEGKCSEPDSVNAVPLEKELAGKPPSLILGDEAKDESKTGKTPTRKPTNLATRKRSTRRSQHEPVAGSASVGSAVSEGIRTRRSSAIRSDDARIITEDSANVSPPKIRRTRRLISDFDNTDAVVDSADCQERDSRRDTKVMSALTVETSKITRKKNTEHLPVVHDVQLVSDKSRVRKRSHDLEEKNTLQAASIEDPINDSASSLKDVRGSARKSKSKASSQISTYSMSRRLTRRQASMLESMSVEDEIDNLPIMDEIDPVQLLDKPEFKGKQDPDEAKVYERSPSTGSESSRQTRSSSVFSQNLAGVSTPKRTRAEKASTSRAKSKKTPIDLEEPKKSDDMAELDQNTLKRAGLRSRNRTNSVSSVQSDNSDVSNSSVRTTRSRSSRINKAPLPEIEEEKMIEDGSAKPAKKVGRKKK